MTEAREREIGARLRAIRRQQGRSLLDVEHDSGGRWKAVVVGSYERGDRTVTFGRLAELAHFYGVPVDVLLTSPRAAVSDPAGPVVVNLDRLPDGDSDDSAVAALARLARHVAVRRGDLGPTVTLRSSDLETIAAATGEPAARLIVELEERGVLADRPATQGRTASRHSSRSAKPAAR